jgi:hypothetical protein
LKSCSVVPTSECRPAPSVQIYTTARLLGVRLFDCRSTIEVFIRLPDHVAVELHKSSATECEEENKNDFLRK